MLFSLINPLFAPPSSPWEFEACADAGIFINFEPPNVEKSGWKAEIPFEQTMSDLLDYWRTK